MTIYVFEAATVTIEGVRLVIVRLPDVVLDNPMRRSVVMARAEHEFGCSPLLLGEDKGRIVGNLHHKRLLEHGFDPTQAPWAQWNMADTD